MYADCIEVFLSLNRATAFCEWRLPITWLNTHISSQQFSHVWWQCQQVIRLEKLIAWISLQIHLFEARCLLLDLTCWKRSDFRLVRIALRWNNKSLGLQARWASDRGEKILSVTSEILGMNCISKGFWWVNWCSIELSYCQVTQDFNCFVSFARTGFNPWSVIVTSLPSDATKTSKTFFKDVSFKV